MNATIYVMLVFFAPEIGSAGIEKVGIYESRQACVTAAEDAGFLPISRGRPTAYEYACVQSQNDYGFE